VRKNLTVLLLSTAALLACSAARAAPLEVAKIGVLGFS